MPVIVLLRVATATIRHQKFTQVHLMVHAAPKQHVTQAEHLAQILARQVIHIPVLALHNVTPVLHLTLTAQAVVQKLVTLV